MLRTLTCPRCGTVFETNHPQTIYCPECRHEARLERQRDYNRQRRGEKVPKENDGVHFIDTPERIATCLTCPLPPKECYGTVCKRLAEVPGYTYQRRERHGRKAKR